MQHEKRDKRAEKLARGGPSAILLAFNPPKRPKPVAEQARNIPAAETFASRCADALTEKLASLEPPVSAPLTAKEVAGIRVSMLQGPELIAFVKEFQAWNKQREGERLSNSALFFSADLEQSWPIEF